MKKALSNAWSSALKLFRFVFWYAAGVAGVFYLLPLIGVFVEGRYDAMTSSAKFLAVIGFFCVIGVWQIVSMKDRMQESFLGK
jgi:hypothetical protein